MSTTPRYDACLNLALPASQAHERTLLALLEAEQELASAHTLLRELRADMRREDAPVLFERIEGLLGVRA